MVRLKWPVKNGKLRTRIQENIIQVGKSHFHGLRSHPMAVAMPTASCAILRSLPNIAA